MFFPLLFKKKKVVTTMFFNDANLYKSKVAIHTGEGAIAMHHLKIWYPVFKASNVEFCIITRTLNGFKAVRSFINDVPIVYVKNPRDVENLLNNLTLKAIFYTSNTGNNVHLCRFNDYLHIFLGHGDSEKTASAHKVFRMYDEIWVSGQAHIDRFRKNNIDMSGHVFRIIGQPFYLHLLECAKSSKDNLYSLLYLPTWEGLFQSQSYCSLQYFKSFIEEGCFDFINVLCVKPHPFTGTVDKSLPNTLKDIKVACNSKKIQCKNIPKHITIDTLLNDYEFFICDCSAVVTACLITLKPIFMYFNDAADYSSSNIKFEDYVYIFRNAEELKNIMNEVIVKGNDYLKEKRIENSKYFVDIDAMKSDSFNVYLNSILGVNQND